MWALCCRGCGELNARTTSVAATVRRLGVAAVLMFGFGYALVPLYNVACEQFGLNGRARTLGRVASSADQAVQRTASDRLVTVEFLGSTAAGLDWEFAPTAARMMVRPGATVVATYRARNRAAQASVGQAVPSVAPGPAAKYFHKFECFCFTRQPLAAGESKDMQVRFQIDPALDPSVSTVTLSYTFFETDAAAAAAS